jgi:hypothetical protein
MINKVKSLLLKLSVGVVLVAPFALVAPAAAQTNNSASGSLCAGTNVDVNSLGTAADTCSSDTTSGTKIDAIVKLAINVFSLVVGLIAVVMIIIGGLKYITSGGDSGNITGAKNTIIYAIVGLVVVALAQFIVHFVLAKAGTAGGA